MNGKNKSKGAKTNMKIKMAESLGVVHTHTSLLQTKIKNKIDIEKAHRLSILY